MLRTKKREKVKEREEHMASGQFRSISPRALRAISSLGICLIPWLSPRAGRVHSRLCVLPLLPGGACMVAAVCVCRLLKDFCSSALQTKRSSRLWLDCRRPGVNVVEYCRDAYILLRVCSRSTCVCVLAFLPDGVYVRVVLAFLPEE